MRITTTFGEITVDNKKFYTDIIVFPNENIVERPKHLSSTKKKIYGHTPLSKEEIEWLKKQLSTKVDVIVVGTGQYGAMPVENEAKKLMEKIADEIIIDETPKAIKKYLELKEKGKSVLAIFHVTC